MVAYQNQFRRAEDQYIADRRQREAQRTRDWEASRQRQREQKFWDERAAYTKRVTTPPPPSKPEPRALVPGHEAVLSAGSGRAADPRRRTAAQPWPSRKNPAAMTPVKNPSGQLVR